MPQPRDAAGDEVKPNCLSRKDAISLSEPADVLCLLLDIIYPGRGLSEDLEIFVDRPVLPLLKLAGLAAVKYAMSSALKAIRAFILSPKTGTKYNAVELYGVASDLGLVDEAKRLSAKTLKCNLNTLETRKYFENMGLDAVLKLQHLHQQRKIILINALSEMTGDVSFYPDASQNYGVVAYSMTFFAARMPHQLKPGHRGDSAAQPAFIEWMQLKTEVARIMEQTVDGTRFFRDEQDFFYNSRFSKLREILDFRVLAREFRRIFESMPKEIDV
ncbi:hypothetical protein SCHPADRAFT_906277 [Schizopora paradoxa]|uniref:BTB domain-containing protein n=1 Tax=Schizopora paradoxa TaxID=27342 RepID=A0A0H2S285_9AGAM|nr:hypothetical protein SCHPADRAFT_906277 [Schizopora paradoxa]